MRCGSSYFESQNRSHFGSVQFFHIIPPLFYGGAAAWATPRAIQSNLNQLNCFWHEGEKWSGEVRGKEG